MMSQTAPRAYLRVLGLVAALSRSDAAVDCSYSIQTTEGNAIIGAPLNTVLTGFVYREIGGISRLQCVASCAKDTRHCYSFNYCHSTKLCQLNRANQARQPQHLTKGEGCSYYDIFVECQTTTDTNYHNVYLHAVANVKRLEFQVKTATNAIIVLSPVLKDHNPMYEIILGAAANKEGAIRRCKQCPNKRTVTEPGLVSGSQFRGFWITFDLNTGELAVGRAGQLKPFMTWVDPSPMDVKYVGFASYYNDPGEYRYFCSI
ncbi:C3 and PZP-like alpha-2-macroglobulin domain-containing protein 8 [Patiria miniata]|uniref:Apple domain-containing protein n=1 Tax=Patiria miniata TaxID=46514 RepID=A0A914B5R2_PATMI|nr:C3 and PZP-like alpha-2-macroglobulin domain-containing protein 8 [Patiria miniata]